MKSPSLSAVQFYCNSSRLDKSKTLLFLTHTLKRVQSINIIHSDVWGMTLVIFMLITSILSLSLVTIVDSYGFIFCVLTKKFFFFVFKLFHAHNQT